MITASQSIVVASLSVLKITFKVVYADVQISCHATCMGQVKLREIPPDRNLFVTVHACKPEHAS